MAYLYGKKLTRRELMKRVGNISQISGARECILNSGRAKGIRAVEVNNGSGLNFTILTDRGMDIAWANYKGIAVSFISKTGAVSPAYYEPEGNNFLRGFCAGLLTTCGLTYMGAACEDEGKLLGLHGRISNIPAEDVCVSNDWYNDEFIMKVRGKVRESVVFGENITLTREIETRLGENRIFVRDVVENCGFDSQPLMLLYHCNFGYPLIDKGTKLILPEGNVKARDQVALEGISKYAVFDEPKNGYQEQVFYHDFTARTNDMVTVKLFNEKLGDNGFGIYITYNKKQLPYFIEWKQMGEGDYVVGLEPATWYTEGRCEARKRGELEFLKPFERRNYELEIGIL